MSGIDEGEYPNQFLGVVIHQNATSGAENQIQAPLKMDTEAYSGLNVIGASFHSGSGVPTCAAGAGAFYFRWDTPTVSMQRIYVCTTGGAQGVSVWQAIA